MKLPHLPRSRRPGFSLIELLVAISIIAILIGLVVVVIIPMLRHGPDMYARDDITKMENALNEFKQKFGVTDAPPAPFLLCAKQSYYTAIINGGGANAALATTSVQYLNRMFPNLPANWTVDWSGGTTAGFTTNAAGVTLDGDQVLVFFLGGIPTKNPTGCKGFGSNPTDPSLASGFAAPPTGTAPPKWNPFPFKEARLYARSANHHFLSYYDAYHDGAGTTSPYIYFSPGRIANGYNSAYTLLGVTAYSKPNTNPTQFWNPSSFQIICAGQDGQFGPGGAWSPATAASVPTIGFDDMSNFYDAKLGVPGQ